MTARRPGAARGLAVSLLLALIFGEAPAAAGAASSAASAAGWGCTGGQSATEAPARVASADGGPSKKRAGPAPVAPVSLGGVRYQALPWGKARGLGQNGGHIAAIDEKTGKELWVLRVYRIVYDGDMEDDKQDLFITGLSIRRDPDRLVVENERGGRYVVDPATRTVTEE